MGKPAVLQKSADRYKPSGHLDPQGFQRNVSFQTFAPTPDLAPFLSHFWVIQWNRAGQAPYVSEQVMHQPFVDLYVSAEDSGIQCTFLGRRDYQAADEGRIVGARFHPGAFHGFWPGAMSGLPNGKVALQRVFPEADAPFVHRVVQAEVPSALDLLADLIRARSPRPDEKVELVNRIIASLETDATLTTVTAVARAFFKSERWLQQLFSDYIGVGLKWLLQRRRLLEAAQRIRDTAEPDWAALAYAHGYSSQQHFITDFRRVLGKTPVQYKTALTP